MSQNSRSGTVPFGDATADDVRRVEIELRLEERRAREVGLAHQRRVRRKNDVLAGNGAAASLDAERLVDHLVARRLLEDVRALPADALRQGAQVLARMKPRLAAEDDARPRDERRVFDELGVEAELARETRFLLKRLHVVVRPARERQVLDAGHPLPLAVDAFGVDDGLDLFDGGKAGIPHRLCVIAAERLDQLGEVRSR